MLVHGRQLVHWDDAFGCRRSVTQGAMRPDGVVGLGRQVLRQRLYRGWLMAAVATYQTGRPSPTRPGLGANWRRARRPHRGVRQNASDIGQIESGDGLAQLRIGAIASVHQHDATRQSRFTGRANLLERNLRLGLEANLFGHMSFAPPRRWSNLAEDRDARPPAGLPPDWPATTTRRSDNCPACLTGCNIAAPHPPNAWPSWESLCHR